MRWGDISSRAPREARPATQVFCSDGRSRITAVSVTVRTRTRQPIRAIWRWMWCRAGRMNQPCFIGCYRLVPRPDNESEHCASARGKRAATRTLCDTNFASNQLFGLGGPLIVESRGAVRKIVEWASLREDDTALPTHPHWAGFAAVLSSRIRSTPLSKVSTDRLPACCTRELYGLFFQTSHYGTQIFTFLSVRSPRIGQLLRALRRDGRSRGDNRTLGALVLKSSLLSRLPPEETLRRCPAS